MTVKQQWMAVGGVVAALAIALWVGSATLGDEFYSVRPGSEAPGFNAENVRPKDGSLKTLSDYRGKVILLNIWATNCLPCRKEMPSMERLHADLATRGLAVVAVSVDANNMDDAIRTFIDEYNLTFDVLYDRNELFRNVYRFTGVPETYVIDRRGVVRKKEIGEKDWYSDANRRFIEMLLAEKGS